MMCTNLIAGGVMRTAAIALLLLPLSAVAAMNDEPLLFMFNAEELELSKESGDTGLGWDIEAWYGTTEHRAIARSEGEREASDTEKFETVLGYSRPLSAFWNINLAVRTDWQPTSDRTWGSVEFEGLAPGFVETRVSALARSGGHYGARLKAETKWFLSTRWRLVPMMELDWYSDADASNGIGSGLSRFEAGLRLGRIIRPDLVPYVGLQVERYLGDTADIARGEGESPRSVKAVAGISVWF